MESPDSVPWDDNPTATRKLSRTIMRSGAFHVRVDPSLDGSGPFVKQDDPRLLELMGQLGYSCVEEIPVGRDYRNGHCQRCGDIGVEDHHIAPRAIFGDSADEWPTVQLCVLCHREWHTVLKSYYT